MKTELTQRKVIAIHLDRAKDTWTPQADREFAAMRADALGQSLRHDRDGIDIDRRFDIKLRNAKSSEGTDDEEKETNLFAAELLLPKRLLDAAIAVQQLDLEDEEALVRLAERYAVSVQALSFRLAYLGFVKI